MDCVVVVVVVGLLVGMVMVMVVMIRVKAGGGRIVELDCEGVIWLVGWLVREEDDGICLCTTGRTDGRKEGIWYSTFCCDIRNRSRMYD